jgi:predicted aspartyl protease
MTIMLLPRLLLSGLGLCGLLFAQPGASIAAEAQVAEQVAEVLVTTDEPKYVAPTLRDRIGRIWAPVYINGQGPLRLVLDTGASTSVITHDAANLLSLDADRARTVLLRGTTGTARVPVVKAQQMEIGDFLAENQRLVLVDDAFGGADGVLATRALLDRRIHVEFRKDRIEITRSKGQAAPPGYSTIPVRLKAGHVPWVDAWVGPVKVKAIIDTGAQQTLGNLALRTALVAARRRGLDARTEGVIGVTGEVQEGTNLAVPAIRLGNVTVRNARVNFLDLHIFDHWRMLDEPALLIGMDVLGVLDTFILDYRRRELQLLTRRN